MQLSNEEKVWLQSQCIDRIILSAAKRIDCQRLIAFGTQETQKIVTSAIIYMLNRFACNGLQFLRKMDEDDIRFFVSEFLDHFSLPQNKQVFYSWRDFFFKIDNYCFREMQALQIVKLEYTSLSREKLKDKVVSKLNESYIPDSDREEGYSEEEMVKDAAEKRDFDDNCEKIRNTLTPL